MASTVERAGAAPRRSKPTDDPVREFYTGHPYPPPVANLDRARDEWRDPGRLRAEFHLLWPHAPFRADLDILVAGCGTWQAAKYALCHPDARVVGIDVSPTSLEHTERLKQQYALANLETRQLALEEVETLGRDFDLVVCTGVVHHLADPDAGLRALRAVLRPRGALYLMVYGRYGRTPLDMLREYCRRLDVGLSARELGDLGAVLEALPPEHPVTAVLRGARDARNADALADALLNPRERSYDVPALLDLLDRTGLAMTRWLAQAPYSPYCGAFAATPHAPRVAALPERDQWAAMELWRGTMGTHSLVARRDDAPDGSTIGFDDLRWAYYVPVRLPDTLCLRERLPAGAAAVLLNRSHPFHDLLLVAGMPDKRLYDAIDGRRTVAEIVRRIGGEETPMRARVLFERLWQYDQIVFDASGVRAGGSGPGGG